MMMMVMHVADAECFRVHTYDYTHRRTRSDFMCTHTVVRTDARMQAQTCVHKRTHKDTPTNDQRREGAVSDDVDNVLQDHMATGPQDHRATGRGGGHGSPPPPPTPLGVGGSQRGAGTYTKREATLASTVQAMWVHVRYLKDVLSQITVLSKLSPSKFRYFPPLTKGIPP